MLVGVSEFFCFFSFQCGRLFLKALDVALTQVTEVFE